MKNCGIFLQLFKFLFGFSLACFLALAKWLEHWQAHKKSTLITLESNSKPQCEKNLEKLCQKPGHPLFGGGGLNCNISISSAALCSEFLESSNKI